MLSRVQSWVLPRMQTERQRWVFLIVDDTGIPKMGTHSVGVARQYCGQLGKTDNCQVAVSLSIATAEASLPIKYRLYLPESWTDDRPRCEANGVPDDVGFLTKPQISLGQIRCAKAAGLPGDVVAGDAGYGDDTDYRDGITGLGLRYVPGIKPTRLRRDAAHPRFRRRRWRCRCRHRPTDSSRGAREPTRSSRPGLPPSASERLIGTAWATCHATRNGC